MKNNCYDIQDSKKDLKKRAILNKSIRILFPSRCPVCDRPVPGLDEGICLPCTETLHPLKEPVAVKSAHIDFGLALYPYRAIAESLYRFKYEGRQEYGAFYAQEIVKQHGQTLRLLHPEAIVPVPVHRVRLQKRGYNQAQVVAEALGRALSIPVRDDLVNRVRPTAPQKELNLFERRNNLKSAFKLTGNDVKLESILLVDDIYTTGATMDALALLFRAQGVKRIFFVTVAMESLS